VYHPKSAALNTNRLACYLSFGISSGNLAKESPLLHLICDDDPGDRTYFAHFCESKISVFWSNFHSLYYSTHSTQIETGGIHVTSISTFRALSQPTKVLTASSYHFSVSLLYLCASDVFSLGFLPFSIFFCFSGFLSFLSDDQNLAMSIPSGWPISALFSLFFLCSAFLELAQPSAVFIFARCDPLVPEAPPIRTSAPDCLLRDHPPMGASTACLPFG
jgi:hypothetical protein